VSQRCRVGAAARMALVDPYCKSNLRFISVVDADALLSSIDNQCRKGWKPRMLRLAASGESILFAEDHVFGEVYRGFDKLARTSPVAPATMRACFEDHYLPVLRWVQNGRQRHERCARVAGDGCDRRADRGARKSDRSVSRPRRRQVVETARVRAERVTAGRWPWRRRRGGCLGEAECGDGCRTSRRRGGRRQHQVGSGGPAVVVGVPNAARRRRLRRPQES